jgi:transposase
MGKPYSNDLRGRVVAAMASGRSCREVGEAFNLAPSTAGNWYRRYQATRSYSARPMGGDRRSKLTDEAGWIAERLDEACGLTLVELRGELARRDIKVSYTSVWRMVRRLGLRHKKNHDLRN